MAKSSIPVPAKMDMEGDLASNWDFFKESWKNYATANELKKKPDEVVAATLLSIIGKDCFKVFKNLPMSDDERQKPDTILEKLTEEFEEQSTFVEAAKQQHNIHERMEPTQPVNFVQKKKSDTKYIKNCKYCGSDHKKGKCSAYGETCSKCKKKNHLAKVCLSSANSNDSSPRQQKGKRAPPKKSWGCVNPSKVSKMP
ncbi:hypothetical protein AC249_AIPGENE27759 [Exaiptasia diaphana]|nr:hypothetical protein AC249_AIPGENE27759 [Exaiptasia diaphana]